MTLKNLPENISDTRLGGCTLIGAIAVTAFITDAVTVIHAPRGCSHQIFSMLHALYLDNGISKTNQIISSNISEKEVIFGGETALSSALDTATKTNPSLIIVTTSCVPETIGDDCAGICNTHPASAKILYLPTSGFLGGTAETGENRALSGLAALAPLTAPIPRTVAIIGEKNLESEAEDNYREVLRLLNRLNISVILRFCRNISTSDIQKLGQASCYIIRDKRVFEAGKSISERFNRPFISAFPHGLTGTIAFLKEIGTACHIPTEEIATAVDAELAYQDMMLKPFEELKGTRICLGIEPFEGTFAIAREAMNRLDITESPTGMPVKLPFYLPIGVSGIVKMLYLWRREQRK